MDPMMADVFYKSLIGNLIYLADCIWLDLAMAVSALNRYCQNP